MIETIACPNCKRQLQVPEQYLGQKVQCPECQHMFVATSMSVSSQPLPKGGNAAASKPKQYDDDDEDDVPRRRRGRDDFDDDDDDEEDNFDGYHQPRRLRRRFAPHRGGLIMALGLVALVGGMSMCAPVILGPVAWMLGTWDLREIREGRMDPEGASMTQTGQVCGIIATVFLILGVPFFCFVFGFG
jgi:hypothetical protein